MKMEIWENPTEEWEVSGVVEKTDLIPLSDLRGTVGMVTMAEATGPQFECEVMFLGFRGREDPKDKKVYGAYRFGPVDGPIERYKRFTTLPGSGIPVVGIVTEESEVDDGVHGGDS